MPIVTYSVLAKLERAVEVQQNRVKRASARVEDLREQYKTAHWSEQRQIAAKGFVAKRTLERTSADLAAAELALKTEQQRLLQPDSFLRFA